MSEGKYGRLPSPKDRSKRGVRVEADEFQPAHDKAAEWEEEDDTYHEHPKRKPEESAMAKVRRIVDELSQGATAKSGSLLSGYLRRKR